MKNKKAFTLIELFVVIAIVSILAALIIPAFQKAKEKNSQNQSQRGNEKSALTFAIGDMVYIDGLDTTGKVSEIGAFGGRINLLVKSTNGTVSTIENVNASLLKRVPQADDWKK